MFANTQYRPDSWKYTAESLGGRRAIVTGGTTGIGRTTALLLATLGAKVLIFGRDEDHLHDALETMGDARDRVTGLTADVSEEAEVDRVFAHADEHLGELDILVNNAGLPVGDITETSQDYIRYVIDTNLIGYIACARRALPRIKRRGGGSIVNIGSLTARERGEGADIYAATKAGLRGFCDSLRKEVEPDGIRVSLIEPGSVGAERFGRPTPEQEREAHAEGTLLFSEAIAEAVVWCLTQPQDCNVSMIQIHPLHQRIEG